MTLPDGYVWAVTAGLVVVVVATRNAFTLLPSRLLPRGAAERALRVAPLAALVALTVPDAFTVVLARDGGWTAAWADGRLPAALATVVVARLARSPFPGLAAGVATLFAIGGLG